MEVASEDIRKQQNPRQPLVPRKSDKGGTYSVYLTNAVAHLMEQAASKEHRSFSNMLDLALREWLGQHGYDLAEAEKTTAQPEGNEGDD